MLKSFNTHYFKIVVITLLSTLLFWLIFSLNLPSLLGFPDTDLKTLFANYDGPNYMVIAKCGYNPDCIRSTFSLGLPLEYYPAHLPGFPLTIKLLDIFLPGPLAMLASALAGSVFLNIFFYKFIALYTKKNKAFWLTIIFTFLPARLFILRAVGAPETWFIGFILASLFYFDKKKYLYSAIFLSFAQIFKTPAVLLLGSYFIYFVSLLVKTKNRGKIIKDFLPFVLVPISVLLIFILYYFQTGDFWAYFNSGDNRHIFPLPFGVFVSNSSWVNGIWLEDLIYIFAASYWAGLKMFKKFKLKPLGTFVLLYTFATTLVVHRDISRYIVPIYPLAFLAFKKHLGGKIFRKVFYILILAVYLYSINFVIANTAPIADWTPYL